MERRAGYVAFGAAVSFSGTRRNYGGQMRQGRKVRGHSAVLVPKCCCTAHSSMLQRTVNLDTASPDGVIFPGAFGEGHSSNDAQLCDGKLG